MGLCSFSKGEEMAKLSSASLFPILSNPVIGIARMAAQAEHAADGHLIEFRTLEVRSILNKSVSKRQLSLAYSINPYRGCEFGCKYCYARYTHEFMAPKTPTFPGERVAGAISEGMASVGVDLRDPLAFERMIFLKQSAAWLLEQE